MQATTQPSQSTTTILVEHGTHYYCTKTTPAEIGTPTLNRKHNTCIVTRSFPHTSFQSMLSHQLIPIRTSRSLYFLKLPRENRNTSHQHLRVRYHKVVTRFGPHTSYQSTPSHPYSGHAALRLQTPTPPNRAHSAPPHSPIPSFSLP